MRVQCRELDAAIDLGERDLLIEQRDVGIASRIASS